MPHHRFRHGFYRAYIKMAGLMENRIATAGDKFSRRRKFILWSESWHRFTMYMVINVFQETSASEILVTTTQLHEMASHRTHIYKYYPTRPKIPKQQMITNQPIKLPTLAYYIHRLLLVVYSEACLRLALRFVLWPLCDWFRECLISFETCSKACFGTYFMIYSATFLWFVPGGRTRTQGKLSDGRRDVALPVGLPPLRRRCLRRISIQWVSYETKVPLTSFSSLLASPS
jgi:hypothetical protein